MKTNPKKIIENQYLEIYINNEGNLIVTPLNRKTLPVVRKIAGAKKQLDTIYCG